MSVTVFIGLTDDDGIDWPRFAWRNIAHELETWLRSCCSKHRGTQVVTIAYQDSWRKNGHDGLVYLVGYASDSIARKVGATESRDLSAGQTTIHHGGMLSEVYVEPLSNYGVGATIYHELLHNKFQNIRNIHGTEDGNFTSATSPYVLGGPSDADQDLMCEALSATASQYIGALKARWVHPPSATLPRYI